MAYDPQGFLKHPRVDVPKRAAAERVRDWRHLWTTNGSWDTVIWIKPAGS